MQIIYKAEVVISLADIMNFIESNNTYGSGVRWLDKFEAFLSKSLTHPSFIKPCNNKTFFELGLRCLNFNDWIIGFSITDDTVIIEALLHSSRLVD